MATATKAKPKVFGKGGPKKLKKFKDTAPSDEDRDNFKLIEHVDEVIILVVKGTEQVKTNKFGVKPAIKADIYQIEGPDDVPNAWTVGPLYKNILIFNQTPIDQLEEFAGETTAARIGTYESQSGGDAPRLEELEDDELEAVETLIESLT